MVQGGVIVGFVVLVKYNRTTCIQRVLTVVYTCVLISHEIVFKITIPSTADTSKFYSIFNENS
jgi:hypothetical protein